MDISTGVSTTYLSIGEAAKAIGSHPTTISNALLKLKEKGDDSIIINKKV